MYTLREETKRAIGEATGLPYDEILSMSHDEEMEYIRKKRPGITFSKEPNPNVRGNPLLVQGKVRTLEDVDKKIDEELKQWKKSAKKRV